MARQISDCGFVAAQSAAPTAYCPLPTAYYALPTAHCPLPTARRRGVILLVVLALLSLFTLMLITFVIATAHFKSSARASSKVEQIGDPPEALLHSALLQIVRGPRNPASVMGAHSLDEDVYGNRTVRGQVTSTASSSSAVPGIDATNIGKGQIVRLVQSAVFLDPLDLDPTDGFFNGRLLTFVDGPAAGRSTRIVGSGNYSGGTMNFDVLAVPGLAPTSNPQFMNFIINGRPFSGTGFGFRLSSFGNDPNEDPAETRGLTRLLDAAHDENPLMPTHLYALLPNQSSVAFHANTGAFNPYTDPAGPGGANEDYDAADFQNMLLAVRMYAGGSMIVPLPSLHRPDLVTYWGKKCNALILDASGNVQGINLTAMDQEIVRGCILRPLTLDHPDFTGSNPLFDPIKGPWDVDNDGDGTPDSIWVDLGLPVQTAPDGRVYKPLFAIMCIDLDGKLNLNAHGNRTHMDYAQSANPNRFRAISGPLALQFGETAQTATPILRVGQGYGPPEISLQHLFQDKTEYVNLLMGLLGPTVYLDGRYGEAQRTLPNKFLPGPGMSRICDPLAWMAQFEHAQVANGTPSGHISAYFADASIASPLSPAPGQVCFGAFTGYGTPPDLDGDGMLALDLRGQPMYISYAGGTIDPAGWGELDERVDNPYELDLSLNARHAGFSPTERFGLSAGLPVGTDMTGGKVSSVDAPFTASELERLLRFNDVDAAGLPDRLLRLAPTAFSNSVSNPVGYPNLRNLVTHASFDLPVPSMVFTSPEMTQDVFALAGTMKTPPLFDTNITQLLRAKLKAKGVVDPSVIMTGALRQLLWPELVMGVKMDLNRPLGNGRDASAANGIVDEWSEVATESSWNEAYSGVAVAFDLDNDGTPPSMPAAKDRLARQLLARHLYVLMMLLKDENLQIDYDGNPANNAFPGQNAIEVAYAIAQWAVNVVDFRDRDSIMTSFEFDMFPFQDDDPNSPGTWDVDDRVGTLTNPSPDDNLPAPNRRGIVWGAERPELVITETLAFHDRRTDDTVAGTAPEKKTDDPDPNKQDNDFDQVKRPLGSLFFELFNPNSPLEPTPGEFTRVVGQQGVDLTKTAPGGAPVWRIVVSTNPDPTRPLDLDDPLNVPPAGAIERAIYFVAKANPLPPGDALRKLNPLGNHLQYYMDSALNPPLPAPILPNRYCVVGPAANTKVGEKTPTPDPPNAAPGTTRRILLNPSAGADTPNQVQVHNNFQGGADETPNNTVAMANIKPPVAVIIDAPRRLSVSEPTGLGGDNVYPPPDVPITGAYLMVDETPFDYGRPGDYGIALKTDATTEGFRLVHLQRLADPLNSWDANNNPYLTIDTAPVDLTAFNGETNSVPDPNAMELGFASRPLRFGTRERGTPQPERPIPAPNNVAKPNLWSQQFDNSVATRLLPPLVTNASLADNTHVFGFKLVHTLGYLNEVLGGYWTNGAAPAVHPTAQLLAPAYPSVNASDYVGDPKTPFPWLTFNNRPYASAMELALVPAVRSSKLLDPTRFSTNNGANDYDPPAGTNGSFNHLLNLFHSQGANGSPNLYRLLEYVQVPSKFVGTQTWFDPAQFSGGTNHTFHPPFNHVSNFRDPGRINVNTIFDVEGRVWGGIMDSLNVNTALQNKVARSRRGIPTAAGLYSFDPAYPTIFAKPFRSYGGNTLVPLQNMRDSSGPGKEIDSTLLRPESATSNKPLFEFTSTAAYNDPTRNPYFRYQDLGRVSNMLTTRSNVYAIWITVGYFEVKYNAIDQQHPDGYQLGAELGSDTGAIQRHRAFYIYDRSIPVGFQRGENHNVEDGIMVQRYIE